MKKMLFYYIINYNYLKKNKINKNFKLIEDFIIFSIRFYI